MRRLMLLTAASAILALSMGPATARAAEGEGRGDHGKVRQGGEDNAHPVPKPVLREEGHGPVRLPPKDIPKEGGVSIFGGTEKRPDGWRYRNENGVWWYWSPKNHWSYYDNGSWQDYGGGSGVSGGGEATTTVEIPVASDPNYYWYKDQWWYLMPGNRWSYFDKGHWHDGAPGMGPPRREVGFRGEPNKDEHAPRGNGPEGSRK